MAAQKTLEEMEETQNKKKCEQSICYDAGKNGTIKMPQDTNGADGTCEKNNSAELVPKKAQQQCKKNQNVKSSKSNQEQHSHQHMQRLTQPIDLQQSQRTHCQQHMSSRASASVRAAGDWRYSQRIGSGSFAKVYKATHVNQPWLQVALKVIKKEKLLIHKRHAHNLKAEIEIMKRLKHENIVRLYDSFEDAGHHYLVLEYCNGGDLSHEIKRRGRLPETDALHYFRQLVEGMRVLRSSGLVHRDLKPQNLLANVATTSPHSKIINNNGEPRIRTLKIADFGFARYMEMDVMSNTLCGSPLYMAPEILEQQKYDTSADLWSIGAILYEMLYGKTPFSGSNPLELLKEIKTKPLKFPESPNISAACKDLMSKLLRRLPEERIDFTSFFAHEWHCGSDIMADSRYIDTSLPQYSVLTPNQHIAGLAQQHFNGYSNHPETLNCVENFVVNESALQYHELDHINAHNSQLYGTGSSSSRSLHDVACNNEAMHVAPTNHKKNCAYVGDRSLLISNESDSLSHEYEIIDYDVPSFQDTHPKVQIPDNLTSSPSRTSDDTMRESPHMAFQIAANAQESPWLLDVNARFKSARSIARIATLANEPELLNDEAVDLSGAHLESSVALQAVKLSMFLKSIEILHTLAEELNHIRTDEAYSDQQQLLNFHYERAIAFLIKYMDRARQCKQFVERAQRDWLPNTEYNMIVSRSSMHSTESSNAYNGSVHSSPVQQRSSTGIDCSQPDESWKHHLITYKPEVLLYTRAIRLAEHASDIQDQLQMSLSMPTKTDQLSESRKMMLERSHRRSFAVFDQLLVDAKRKLYASEQQCRLEQQASNQDFHTAIVSASSDVQTLSKIVSLYTSLLNSCTTAASTVVSSSCRASPTMQHCTPNSRISRYSPQDSPLFLPVSINNSFSPLPCRH